MRFGSAERSNMSRPLLWPLATALLPSLFLVLSNAPSFIILNVCMNVSPTLVDGRSPRLGTGRKQVSNMNIRYKINASVINPVRKGKVQRQLHCICKHELSSGMAQPKTTVLSGQLKSVQTAPECPAHTPGGYHPLTTVKAAHLIKVFSIYSTVRCFLKIKMSLLVLTKLGNCFQ